MNTLANTGLSKVLETLHGPMSLTLQASPLECIWVYRALSTPLIQEGVPMVDADRLAQSLFKNLFGFDLSTVVKVDAARQAALVSASRNAGRSHGHSFGD